MLNGRARDQGSNRAFPQRIGRIVNLDLTLPAIAPLASALVIDDNEDVLYLLRFLLMRDGFVVHPISTGRDALAYVKDSEPPDIVITDLMLPHVSGFEIITQIRESPKWADVPIIVLSGKVTEADAIRALECGANDYITKPYNPQELSARIKRHVAISRGVRV